MTKNVHIINADESKWRVNVHVHVQDQVYDYDKKEMTNEWKTTETFPLDYAGALLTKYITSTRRILIEEAGSKV